MIIRPHTFENASSGNLPGLSTGNLPDVCALFSGYLPNMENKSKKEYIRARMLELGFNQRSLALKAGLHEDAVRNFLSGKSKNFRSDTHDKIMQVLEPAGDKSSEVVPLDAGSAYIPVYDVSASAGAGQIIVQENILYHLTFRKEWLRRITNAPLDRLGVISVDGDSMEPTLSPEDTVLVDTSQTFPKKDGIYVLRYHDAVLVKRIQIDPVRNTATILSDNPAYPPINHIRPEEISVVGRVLWLGRRV